MNLLCQYPQIRDFGENIAGLSHNFQKPSKKKDKLLKTVITLEGKAVKSKALKVNRKV